MNDEFVSVVSFMNSSKNFIEKFVQLFQNSTIIHENFVIFSMHHLLSHQPSQSNLIAFPFSHSLPSAVKPLRVKIVTPNELLNAKQAVPIRCNVWGSFPAAKIVWLLDGEPLRSADITVHSENNVSMLGPQEPTNK